MENRRIVPWKRLVLPAAAALIVAAMVASLSRHGEAMLRATSGLEPGHLALALVLSIAYRAINASGWGLVLRSLGEPVSLLRSARIWLASEACRWLPGSLWSFGSRAVLASQRGVPGPTVAASLILELAVTVAAWTTIACLGATGFQLQRFASNPLPAINLAAVFAILAVAGACGALASRSNWVRRRLRSAFASLRGLAQTRPDLTRLGGAYVFYLLMGLFNGFALFAIIRTIPGGTTCSLMDIVAANALSWLVGFFALFAPGGLVVREACLTAVLSAWIPAEQALAVALVWRLIQILAEVVCFLAVSTGGLPSSLETRPERHAIPS